MHLTNGIGRSHNHLSGQTARQGQDKLSALLCYRPICIIFNPELPGDLFLNAATSILAVLGTASAPPVPATFVVQAATEIKRIRFLLPLVA